MVKKKKNYVLCLIDLTKKKMFVQNKKKQTTPQLQKKKHRMQSVKQLKPSELSQAFGAQNAACLSKQDVVYVPHVETVAVNTPCNFKSFVQKTRMVPVVVPHSYKSITMKPQVHMQNSVCPPQQPQMAPPTLLPQQQQPVACSTGSCSKGPYQPSAPLPLPPMSACGSGCGGGYGGVPPGYGGQMAYAPAPLSSSATHAYGVRPQGASYASASY